jgi:SAM-dependent methyltransferase
VAVPLAERGVPVTGIELSPPMIERLRSKVDDATIPVIAGDMTTVRAPGEYTLVYLVYNTISNLLTQAEQVACFRNAARHLTPGGRFVIELWLFRSPHRYIWPAELDLIAQLAGFELETRHADWVNTEFTAESRSHVSVYRSPRDHP